MAVNKGLLTEIAEMKFDTTNLIDFGVHLTEHDISQILAKIREVVEGARLTDEEINFYKHLYTDHRHEHFIYDFKGVAQAQVQAILKAIK